MDFDRDGAQTGVVLGGRYRLLDRIGFGGMAVVWRAHDNVLDRTIAVKVLAAKHVGDPESRRRIRHEARAAATLSHPNIAQVHDYGEAHSRGEIFPYVVMELVSGGTLLQRLENGPVAPRFAMRVCAEIAGALAAAHAEGLVHRDVKLANVMLAPTGAKVVDFGIAAAAAPEGSGATDMQVFGTPAYVAPERLLHDAVEPASDVYALGVLLFRLLAGHSPWTSESTTQMLAAHIYLDPAPLPNLPGVPDYITALTDRCLAKNPAMRPSARETAALLAQAAGLRTVADEPPPVADEPPRVAGAARPVVIESPPAAAESLSAAAESLSAAGESPPAAAASAGVAAAASAGVVAASPPRVPARSVRRWALIAALLLTGGAGAWLLWPTGSAPGDAVPPAGLGTSGPAASPSRSGVPGAGAASPTPSPSPTASTRRVPGGGRTPGAIPVTTGVPPVRQPGAPAATTTAPPATSTPSLTPTTQPAPPEKRDFTSDAGTLQATCPSADTAHILSWSATKPYKVKSADGTAGPAPEVVFKHGNDRVTMTVTCTAGVPAAVVS